MNSIRQEPIFTTSIGGGTVVAGIIAFAMKMGWVHFTDHQRWLLMTFIAMVLPPILALISRQWVSPVGRKVAAALTAVETVAAKPATKTLITEGEAVINEVLAHAPTEGQAVAVAVTPAPVPAVPDGAPVQP